MSNSFSRTTRSIKADSYRNTLIALTAAIILVAGWCLWFWHAKLSVYATSETIDIKDRNTIIATFPAFEMDGIQKGQNAKIQILNSKDEATITIPAMVMSKKTTSRDAKDGTVNIARLRGSHAFPKHAKMLVAIKVNHTTPSKLLVKNTGLFLKNEN